MGIENTAIECVCTKKRERDEAEENCINRSIKIHIFHCVLLEMK